MVRSLRGAASRIGKVADRTSRYAIGADKVSAQHVADACAAGAVCLFGASLATIDTVVQIAAGLLTAMAAAVSLALHIRRWIEKRKR